MSRVVARSPELKAGWPQQLCGGTSTLQPASSRSFAAAKPTEGRIRSTRQVTNSPTRLVSRAAIIGLRCPGRNRNDIAAIGLPPQAAVLSRNELARPEPGENVDCTEVSLGELTSAGRCRPCPRLL